MVVNAKCDDVIIGLCERLGIPIWEWKLERFIEISRRDGKLEVAGWDEQLNYYSIFKSVSVHKGASKKKKSEEPYLFKDEKANVKVKMEFQGHYNEKPLEIEFSREECIFHIHPDTVPRDQVYWIL